MHSHESLDFVPRLAKAIPLLRDVVAARERRYERRHGHPVDYAGAYWTPPLSEREAFELEKRQIEGLQSNALVSLTDHDNIEAASHLHLFEQYRSAPVSVEWTVPYGETFLHLGVHNLPRSGAREWMRRLAEFRDAPREAALREILAALSAQPDVLVVLNHPLWDEIGLEAGLQRELLLRFLSKYGAWLHALELNGMRSWPENRTVMEIAQAHGHVVVSGGDRHGSEPNCVLNLTDAATFGEFVDQIRRRRISHVLLLAGFRPPYRQRYAEALWEVMREYPEHEGRVRWTDRFYYRTAAGAPVPLSTAWGGDGPGIIGTFLSLVRMLGSRRLRSTLRFAMRSSSEALP